MNANQDHDEVSLHIYWTIKIMVARNDINDTDTPDCAYTAGESVNGTLEDSLVDS